MSIDKFVKACGEPVPPYQRSFLEAIARGDKFRIMTELERRHAERVELRRRYERLRKLFKPAK